MHINIYYSTGTRHMYTHNHAYASAITGPQANNTHTHMQTHVQVTVDLFPSLALSLSLFLSLSLSLCKAYLGKRLYTYVVHCCCIFCIQTHPLKKTYCMARSGWYLSPSSLLLLACQAQSQWASWSKSRTKAVGTAIIGGNPKVWEGPPRDGNSQWRHHSPRLCVA